MIRAIVTDIEGTVAPVSFVTRTLFPYARAKLPAFVRENHQEADVAVILDHVRELSGHSEADPEELIQILLGWMDEDRKATPLKELQGVLWREGYESGMLKSELYEDVAPVLRAWYASGIDLFVYSSGSVEAQKLLFAHTPDGDLTPLFSGYFDTHLGPKTATASYTALAARIGTTPPDILFLSDSGPELDAAAAAGLETVLINRDEIVAATAHPVHTNFASIGLRGDRQ